MKVKFAELSEIKWFENVLYLSSEIKIFFIKKKYSNNSRKILNSSMTVYYCFHTDEKHLSSLLRYDYDFHIIT